MQQIFKKIFLTKNYNNKKNLYINFIFFSSFLFIFSACDGRVTSKKSLPSGERINVLTMQAVLKANPVLENLDVKLPRPFLNKNWLQDGGSANNSMHHLVLNDTPLMSWRANIGKRGSEESWLLSKPIVVDGVVYTIDSQNFVESRNLKNGNGLWRVGLSPKNESPTAVSGGIASDGRKIYANTGYGEVFALDLDNGKIIWKKNVGQPLRGFPTLAKGNVIVLSIDNKVFALDSQNGSSKWVHVGVPEITSMLGSSSVAVDENVVIVPYSSGSIFALNLKTGKPIWSENIIRGEAKLTLSRFNDVSRPIIDRGIVFAVGLGGRMMALDLKSGSRVWAKNISAQTNPWVAGDFLYLISQDNELLALTRDKGLIRWLTPLPVFDTNKKDGKKIVWTGPVLASDRLVVVSSLGKMLAVSPYTGKILGNISLTSGTFVEPVLADGTLLVLTTDGKLSAYH